MGVLIQLVHRAADLDAPVRRLHGEPDIEGDGDRDDRQIFPVELVRDDGGGKTELEERRQRVEDGKADDDLDAVDGAFDDARQAAGAPLQVVAQRQIVHVLEGLVGEVAHGVLADAGEERVAQVVEHVDEDAADAVGDDQHDGNGDQHRQTNRERPAAAGGGRAGQRVGRPFVGVGHQNGDELGGNEHAERHNHPALQVRPIARPHVGPHVAERREHGFLHGGARRRCGFAAGSSHGAGSAGASAPRWAIAAATEASASRSRQ